MLGMLRTLGPEWSLSDRIALGASISRDRVLFALFLCDDDDEVAGRAALVAPGDDDAAVLRE